MDKAVLRRYIICGVILLVIVMVTHLALLGGDSTPAPRPISAEKASSVYEKAISALQEKSNISMTVFQTKTTTVSMDIFSEESEQKISYTGLGTEDLSGFVDQRLSIGSHTVSIQEIYNDNTGYFTVAGVPFSGSITQEEYLARYIPVIPITASLYETVSGQIADKTTQIRFTDATGIESWLAPYGATLITASGVAYVDDDGALYRSDYNVAYTYNGIEFRQHFNAEITATDNVTVNIPEDTSIYTPIHYLDAPRMLEEACGYLMAADNITADYKSEISYQAYGDSLTEEIKLNILNKDTWAARLDTNLRLTNTSLGGVLSDIQQTEIFKDGAYSISTNGNPPAENPEIDGAAMRSICRDLLIGSIMLPEYIVSAELTETETSYNITLTASEDFAKLIYSDICQRLYQDPSLSDELSQNYKTNTMLCYLDLDKISGMPIASGIDYIGEFKKDAISYKIACKTRQDYDLSSQTTYNSIYEKAGA